MSLDVRGRVAVAMTAVVLMSVLTGGLSWWFGSVADGHAAEAARAAERARWVSEVSSAITSFNGQAGDLAFGVSGGVSEEGSSEYGDLTGVDAHVSRLLKRPPEGMLPADLDRITEGWASIRIQTLVWINAEAEAAASPTRLTLQDDGGIRASVISNISTPAALANVSGVELRRLVRSNSEALVDGSLRAIASAAVEERDVSAELAVSTRRSATSITIALLIIGLVVAVVVSAWLYGTIVGPLNEAKRIAELVALGEYGAQFKRHSSDEVGVLVDAIERMRDVVVTRIDVMREMAGAILVTNDGVREAAANGDLARVSEGTVVLGTLAEQMLDG